MFSGQELTLREIEAIARSLRGLIYHVSLGGGEPSLRDDLAEIALAYVRHARVRSMLIVSNGSAPERLAVAVDRLLAEPIDLLVSLSSDDVGDAHDTLRGRPGLFAELMDSYRRLAPLRAKGLSLNVNLTLSRLNQARVEDILEKAMAIMPDASFTITAVRGRTADTDAAGVDPERYAAATALTRRSVRAGHTMSFENFSFGRRLLHARNDLLRDVILRTLSGKPPSVPCYAGKLTGVLSADGSVYPCEMLARPMGNVRDYKLDFPSVWLSGAGDDVRQSIDVVKCRCTYECAWGVNVLFTWRTLMQLMLRSSR